MQDCRLISISFLRREQFSKVVKFAFNVRIVLNLLFDAGKLLNSETLFSLFAQLCRPIVDNTDFSKSYGVPGPEPVHQIIIFDPFWRPFSSSVSSPQKGSVELISYILIQMARSYLIERRLGVQIVDF